MRGGVQRDTRWRFQRRDRAAGQALEGRGEYRRCHWAYSPQLRRLRYDRKEPTWHFWIRRIRRAEPGLDLALFRTTLVDLCLRALEAPGDAPRAALQRKRQAELDGLCAHFLAGYEEVAPVDRERLALWDAVTLAKDIVDCWRKIKFEHLDRRMEFLRQRCALIRRPGGNSNLAPPRRAVLYPLSYGGRAWAEEKCTSARHLSSWRDATPSASPGGCQDRAMSHAHVAGAIHADAEVRAPHWLDRPGDVNALLPRLWSSHVEKNAAAC